MLFENGQLDFLFFRLFSISISRSDKYFYLTSKCLKIKNFVTLAPKSNLRPDLFKNETNQPYDSTGAAKYIVGFILIYGFAIVLFIGSQVKSSRSQDDNVDSQNAEQVLQQMESTIFTKEVLNKLLDKEHREKAWKIYLTNDKEMKDPNSSSANTDEEELMKQVVVQEAIENMERKANEKQPKPTKLEIFRDRIISLCTKQKRSPTHLR